MSVETKNAAPGGISRKYARAPITEAIIEIRVTPASGINAASCESVFSSLGDEFSQRKELLKFHAEVSGGETVGASAAQHLVGYVFRSKDERQTVSAFPDRFVFSQLPPYDGWETFCPTARRLWRIFRSETKPERIVRIATRFVNRIEIPLPIKDIAEYFRTAPVISPDMAQDLIGYFIQLQLPQNDLMCMVMLQQALMASDDSGIASFLLDIDIFDNRAELQADELIWDRLLAFRWRKNEIFEACITDRVRDLIS